MITLRDGKTLDFNFTNLKTQICEIAQQKILETADRWLEHDWQQELELHLKQLASKKSSDKNKLLRYEKTCRERLKTLDRDSLCERIKRYLDLKDLIDGCFDEPCGMNFQRTVRVPDDGGSYPLPCSYGSFPLVHVDDYAARLPASMLERGGVLMPMRQAEALWISFYYWSYPCVIKIAAGKINALTGKEWSHGLSASPQNYVVANEQLWLDGWRVKKDTVRQFVAMPLEHPSVIEKQITGKAEFGGIQLEVIPMKASYYVKNHILSDLPKSKRDILVSILLRGVPSHGVDGWKPRNRILCKCFSKKSMGLAAGGKINQQIYKDPYGVEAWDTTQSCRCFVHILNAQHWNLVTGKKLPPSPITMKEYVRLNYPWFDYYRDDVHALSGKSKLAYQKSLADFSPSYAQPPKPHSPDSMQQVVRQNLIPIKTKRSSL